MAQAKFTTKVDRSLLRRLKTYSAISGQTIQAIVSALLDEKLPPLPSGPSRRLTGSEATS